MPANNFCSPSPPLILPGIPPEGPLPRLSKPFSTPALPCLNPATRHPPPPVVQVVP